MKISPGKYRHFKGKLYEVIGVAKHSETLEEYVVYKALYDSEFCKNALWIRPLKMFTEKVKVGDKEVNRFEYISN
jgi:cyclomaltodextrinase / maltogenic alpha-amylase / neopullulanase